MEHVNLTAYDDVENLGRFTDELFVKYCENKLQGCSDEVEYVKRNIANDDWSGKICEIGSGNSKLLYRLEKEGLLKDGHGIEVSPSRHNFAEKFKEFIGSKNVENINKNFLDMPPYQDLDLIMSVDITFQLIAALSQESEKTGLKWMYDSLRPGGSIVLELRYFKEFMDMMEKVGGEYKFWEEFPASDPFEFVLARISKGSDGLLRWEKNFMERNSMKRSLFVNVFKPYNHKSIKTAFESIGFKDVEFSKNWRDDNSQESDIFVVRAKK